jgi:hypothetical protein
MQRRGSARDEGAARRVDEVATGGIGRQTMCAPDGGKHRNHSAFSVSASRAADHQQKASEFSPEHPKTLERTALRLLSVRRRLSQIQGEAAVELHHGGSDVVASADGLPLVIRDRPQAQVSRSAFRSVTGPIFRKRYPGCGSEGFDSIAKKAEKVFGRPAISFPSTFARDVRNSLVRVRAPLGEHRISCCGPDKTERRKRVIVGHQPRSIVEEIDQVSPMHRKALHHRVAHRICVTRQTLEQRVQCPEHPPLVTHVIQGRFLVLRHRMTPSIVRLEVVQLRLQRLPGSLNGLRNVAVHSFRAIRNLMQSCLNRGEDRLR